MSDPVAKIRIAGDLLCCVPDSNALLTPFVLHEQGDWFEDEIHFVRKLMQPGMHVVDIGANYGTYSLTMASLIGPTGQVHAYEPARQPIRMLKQSITTNALKNIDLHEVGLSNRSGSANMAISANPELNSLTGAKQEDDEQIALMTLDEALGEYQPPIAFIKMDAEGEEERILEGASRFLARQHPLIMFELKHGNQTNEGLCEAFMRRGFLIHRLVPGPNVLAPIPLGEPLDGYLLNAFAVRPDMEQELIRRDLLVPLRVQVPEAVSQIRVQEMVTRLQASAWLGTTRINWEPDASIPGWEEHRRAVAYAVASEGMQAAGRIACLRNGMAASRKALVAGVTGSRVFTAARIALDLGYRAEAVQGLQKLFNMVAAGHDLTNAFKEPFVLPHRHHETLTNVAFGELLAIATVETFAWKSVFSAYFAGDGHIAVYEKICGMPGVSERSKRVLALLQDKRKRVTVRT